VHHVERRVGEVERVDVAGRELDVLDVGCTLARGGDHVGGRIDPDHAAGRDASRDVDRDGPGTAPHVEHSRPATK